MNKSIIIISLTLILAGGLVWKSTDFTAYRRDVMSVKNPGHESIECILYTPLEKTPPYPLVITLHSIFQCESLVKPLMRELVRSGYAVVYIHFKGYDREQKTYKNFAAYCMEIQSVLSHMAERDTVDREHIALVGHSIGANLATEVSGTDRRISTTIALGFPASVHRNLPVNNLYVIGLLDELHPVREMLDELRTSTGNQNAAPGIIYGDFSSKSARKLVVAPLCDHHLEIFDPFFFSETVAWLDRSAGKNSKSLAVNEPIPTIGYSIFLFGMALLSLESLFLFTHGIRKLKGIPLWLEKRMLTLIALPILIIFSMAAVTGRGDLFKETALMVLISLMGANYIGNDKAFWSRARKGLLHGAVIWLAFWCGIIVNRVDFIVTHPAYVASLPLTLLISLPLDLYVFAAKTASLLFSSQTIVPVFCAPLLVELLLPGVVLSMIIDFLSRITEFLKNIRISLSVKSSPATLVLLAVAIVAAVIVWRQILHEGYDFSGSAFTGFIFLLFNLVVVPLLLSILAFRSSLFRKLAAKAGSTP